VQWNSEKTEPKYRRHC